MTCYLHIEEVWRIFLLFKERVFHYAESATNAQKSRKICEASKGLEFLRVTLSHNIVEYRNIL